MTNETQISTDRQMLIDKNNRNDQRQIFTDREAAAYLRIGQTTLWRLRKDGKISYRRASAKLIYTRVDLDNYLEGTKRAAYATN